MQVTIDWSESVEYRSVIEVDDAAFEAWLRERGTNDDLEHAAYVAEYLESVDDDVWFEQCDTGNDFMAVTERSIDGVEVP